jgi:transposase
MAQACVDESHRPGLTSDEGKELAQVRRRNCVLEVENKILKRAAACFAKDDILPE